MFETAKIITNARFAPCVPQNVYHREAEKLSLDYHHDASFCNRHVLFRRAFSLDTLPSEAILHITADDYYKLYVNGVFVTQGPAPGYEFHYYYNSVDISAYLRPGKNVIAVHTYYQGLINRVWVSADLRHMLTCQLDCDGKTVLVSDETWKTAEHTGYPTGKTFGYETQYAENYDSRSPEDGFPRPDFDDGAWDYAKEREHADYVFFPQPTEQLALEEVSPARIARTEHADGTAVLFCDLGYEAVGYLHLKARGVRGTVITIRCGEECLRDADGNDLDAVRFDMRCNCKYEEFWTLSGGDDTLAPYDYRGFRYFELHLPAGCRMEDADITVLLRHYPYRAVISCPSDDPTVKKIWKLCEDTIRYGVQEVYMDCPTREKGQYLGDGTVSSASHVLLTGDGSMMKKALYEYARSTFLTDGIMTVAPSALMQEIADYSMQYPEQLLWYYLHTGDRETLEALAPYAEGAARYFRAFDRGDGLLEKVDTWNLIDWPENLRDNYDFPATKPIGDGCHNVINAFWFGCLHKLNEIRVLLGQEPDTAYEEKVAKAFVSEFYDREQHLFTDAKTTKHTAIHSNVLPLYYGLLPYTEDDEARASVISLIERKGLTCMGVYMSYFTLMGLRRAGEDGLVMRLLTSPGAWCNMLAEGATTTYEAWGRDQKWNTSLFHPWATAPILVLADDIRI